LAKCRVRRGETRDRQAEGRAADVVQPNLMGEGDRRRLTALLTADAEDEAGTDLPAKASGRGDELPDAGAVQHLKPIGGEDPLFDVGGQESAGVVAAPAGERRTGPRGGRYDRATIW
jgi:hypothetical protein